MKKELERWREIGDAAIGSPGKFLILIIWQWLCYIKDKILRR